MAIEKSTSITENAAETALISAESADIRRLIYVIRGQQVMLDSDLAMLYGVETKRLNESVKRNIRRFPESFCFHLTPDEMSDLRSQIATSNSGAGGRRYVPYAFTEQGMRCCLQYFTAKRPLMSA